MIVEVPEGSNEAVVIQPEKPPKRESSIRYYSGSVLLTLGALAFLYSSRGRRTVRRSYSSSQNNIKHAKELVELFKKQKKRF